MSTHVVNEFHAKPWPGGDVLALLLELSPESQGRPDCEAISIRRNQDDPNNVIGDARWTTRQHYDDYLTWRTQHGYTAHFNHMLSEPMLIRYLDEIRFAQEASRSLRSPGWNYEGARWDAKERTLAAPRPIRRRHVRCALLESVGW
jgi:quinol monooxygenase YgiN